MLSYLLCASVLMLIFGRMGPHWRNVAWYQSFELICMFGSKTLFILFEKRPNDVQGLAGGPFSLSPLNRLQPRWMGYVYLLVFLVNLWAFSPLSRFWRAVSIYIYIYPQLPSFCTSMLFLLLNYPFLFLSPWQGEITTSAMTGLFRRTRARE